MPYDPNAKIECPACYKVVSMNNYARHLKTCKAGKEVKPPPFIQLDKNPNINNIKYHVIYRTDCFRDVDSKDKFLSNWAIYNNIHAQCGPHIATNMEQDIHTTKEDSTKHSHAHFIGSWANVDRKYSSKFMASHFTLPFAYKRIQLYDESTEEYMAHYRLLQAIYYIQTVNGKHKKFDHSNPIVFSSDYSRKKYIKILSSNNLWLIVQYQDYCLSVKQRYLDMQRLFASNPEKYPSLTVNPDLINIADNKLNHCLTTILQITNNNLFSYQDVLDSYNKYLTL